MQPLQPSKPIPIYWFGQMEDYAQSRAVRHLDKLAAKGDIKITEFTKWDLMSGKVKALIREEGPWAIIQRPTTWSPGVIEVGDFPHPCHILNLAVGSEHLKDFPPEWLLLSARGSTATQLSAQMVAQTTVTLANSLLRRLIPAAVLASNPKQFHNQHSSLIQAGSLLGKHWLCLAGGNQVRELLPLLKVFGVAKVTIWDRESEPDRLRKRFQKVTELLGRPQQALVEGAAGDVERFCLTADGFTVAVTNDYRSVASQADIISIHANSAEQRKDGTGARSPLPLDDDFFKLLKPSALVINTARGKLVDESAVVRALQEKKIAGYATDVLYPEAEWNGDPEASPLWQYYLSLCQGTAAPGPNDANLLITPHVGGSVADLFSAFLDELVPALLTRLNLPPLDELVPALLTRLNLPPIPDNP